MKSWRILGVLNEQKGFYTSQDSNELASLFLCIHSVLSTVVFYLFVLKLSTCCFQFRSQIFRGGSKYLAFLKRGGEGGSIEGRNATFWAVLRNPYPSHDNFSEYTLEVT